MKKILSLLSLAALTIGLLGSCSKINERIDSLEKRIDGIESTSIASVQQQIDGIKASITKLEAADVTVNGKIADLKTAADAQQALIDALKEADKALGQKDTELEARIAALEGQVATINGQIKTLEDADKAINDRIDELKSYVDTEIGKTKDWAEETFASLTEYEKTADDLAALSVTVTGISTTLAGMQTSISGLDTKINGIDTALQGKITAAKTELEGKITSLKTELEGKIAEAISASETSIKTWVNELLEGYYTAAVVDAKIGSLNTAIEAAKGTAKTRIDSVATELTELKKVVDTEKATIRTEYKEAIKVAIDSLDGEIRGALLDSIAAVNGRIEALDTRVTTLEGKVLTLEGNVDNLLAMIQSVSIIPAYSDGSVKAVDGILTLKCIVSPAEALIGMKSLKDSLLIYADSVEVKTKAAPACMKIKVEDASILDEELGVITLTADISESLPKGEDKALTVALHIKNGISDFTTEFVPVYVYVAPAPVAPEGFAYLGVKDANGKPLFWAECNLGASNPQDYGDYFAWGETAPYYTTTGGWPATPAWKEGKTSGYKWDSYCGQSSFDEWSTPPYDATTKILKPEFDAATAADSNWRTPTRVEFDALAAGCVWIWTNDYNSTGKAGYIVYKAKSEEDKGKANRGDTWKKWGGQSYSTDSATTESYSASSDTHIFFPAVGYGSGTSLSSAGSAGRYWSSSIKTNNSDGAYNLYFTSNIDVGPHTSSGRYYGCSVRPVTSGAAPAPAPLPTGALKGEFSVSATKKVHFSKGNLQATYNSSASTYTWGFAANQYSRIGNAAGNTTIDTQTDGAVVDLFGYVGASSTFSSSPEIYGVSTSTTDSNYGNVAGEALKKDWGTAIDDKGTWSTLSTTEWQYLFNTRTNAGDKVGYATVGGANGIILLPDTFIDPMKNGGSGAFAPKSKTGYGANVYTTGGNWEAMESAGAVFLPAAGNRSGSSVSLVGERGYYWSSTASSGNQAYRVNFTSSNVNPGSYVNRFTGYSVRLVTEVK